MDDSDRISSLPDGILCHILSLLSTKESVSTSFLSKRWNPIWRSVPTFHIELDDLCEILIHDFDDSYFYDIDSIFVRSVKTFLSRRGSERPFRTFCLTYRSFFYDTSNIESWFNTATSQGSLEHLDLRLADSFELPSFVLACKSLVVLKLTRLRLKDLSSVDLPNLKVLHFNYVQFSEGADAKQFLSGCPNLKYMEVRSLFDRLQALHCKEVEARWFCSWVFMFKICFPECKTLAAEENMFFCR